MEIEKLELKTVTKIFAEDDMVFFNTTDGEYKIFHEQDCCESVRLINDYQFPITPFFIIGIDIHEENIENEYEVQVITTISFETDRGDFTLVWDGSSDGYYGVSVDLYKETKDGWCCW
jgi:hypothetical protein